jgi:hypothetical protein
MVWAEYEGGQIVKGNLLGKVVNDSIELVYHHLNTNHEIMMGKCRSFPDFLPDGKIKIKEFWQWTCKDNSFGESIIIEI